MKTETVFESDRIRFVRVSEDLIADYLVMVNDHENVGRFIRAARDGSFTEEQERAWVREKLGARAPVFSMIEKETGDFIGNIEFMDPADDRAELGIAITAEKQDLGFGTEAVVAMTAYGFEKLGFTSVRLRTRPYNPRAIRVYQKCGFREYDRSDEHVFMELKKR